MNEYLCVACGKSFETDKPLVRRLTGLYATYVPAVFYFCSVGCYNSVRLTGKRKRNKELAKEWVMTK